jgi:proteasome assembly chaperone (PAC2) family protein
MNELVELWEKAAAAKYMIAGWQQWADAGEISSGLPQYLIEQAHARKIGRIKPDGFYLFQIPGTHHFLRPVVKLSEGYREAMGQRNNEFFYAGEKKKGFLIFLGEEPHQNEEQYADAFFDVAEALGVKRIAAVAGVYGPVPYNKERDISCVYSLPGMKKELAQYAFRFSNYEGGTTISTYLADRAEPRGVEFFACYALVPAYNFSTQSMVVHPVAVAEDHKAWYDVMVRLNRMFDLGLDLSDLERRSEELVATWDAKIEHLAQTMPQLGVGDYMQKVDADFTEEPSENLGDVWEEALRDLFGDEGL